MQPKKDYLLNPHDVSALLANIATDPASDYAVISSTWNRSLPGGSVVFSVRAFRSPVPVYFGVIRYLASKGLADEYEKLGIDIRAEGKGPDTPCKLYVISYVTRDLPQPGPPRVGSKYRYYELRVESVEVPLEAVAGNGTVEGENRHQSFTAIGAAVATDA